jgi:hypothetical protein
MLNMLLEIKAMMETQNPIPAQVLLQKPFILNDARGRIMPFHLEFIDSPEALIAVMMLKFKDLGHEKIARDEFLLYDSARGTVIDLRAPWQLVFKVCYLAAHHISADFVSRDKEST